MKTLRWEIKLGIILAVLSFALYSIHYFIFRDINHIFIYLLGDIAFIPLQVLLVTLILSGFLKEYEKRSMMKKLNMAIGVFFSEVGRDLLKSLSGMDTTSTEIKKKLIVDKDWSEKEFDQVKGEICNYKCAINLQKEDLTALRNFLMGKKDFLLGLLENPNLLEHEKFTDLLWAVFHLDEELIHRKNINELSSNDFDHFVVDIERVYVILIQEWLEYMKHLRSDYPFLFAFAMRTNPFDPEATVEIK